MSKKKVEIPAEKLAHYDKLVAACPEIERKGVNMPYTSANGHMFSIMSKTGSLGIRLPKDEREAFLEKYNTTLFENYGAVMREYVTIPDDLLPQTEILKSYLDMSHAYVKSLKPKPTKKKKS